MTAHIAPTSTHASNRRLGDLARAVMVPALIVGGLGLLAAVLITQLGGGEGAWDRFLRSYLMAFMVALSISLGGLFFTMLHHAVKAGWSVTVRRIAEGLASNLKWLWLFFLPIFVVVALDRTHMYHWMHVVGEHGVDEILLHKAVYFFGTNPVTVNDAGEAVQTLHVPWFWLVRAVLYFVIWAILAKFFVGQSVAQDATGDVVHTRRMERWAPLGLLLYALTQTFAAFDWMMALEPHWFSTMFPVYFFAASACGMFATMILLAVFMQRSGRITNEVTPEHYQDLGKLLFAFGIVFWAYIAFSQYMLIWYANIPEETGWYMVRQLGGWKAVSLTLLIGHFFVPFLALLSKHPKRVQSMVALAAAWMLAMHVVDIYWLVMPKIPTQLIHDAANYAQLRETATNEVLGYAPGLLDLACLAGMLGLLLAGTFWRLGGASLIPERDPRLHEALAFENM